MILGQKSCFWGPTIFKIPQPNWYYYAYIVFYNVNTRKCEYGVFQITHANKFFTNHSSLTHDLTNILAFVIWKTSYSHLPQSSLIHCNPFNGWIYCFQFFFLKLGFNPNEWHIPKWYSYVENRNFIHQVVRTNLFKAYLSLQLLEKHVQHMDLECFKV